MKKSIMKLFMPAVIAVLACGGMMTSCSDKGKIEAQQSRIDSLLAANEMTADQLEEYINIVNGVSSSLDYMMHAQDEITAASKEGTPQERREQLQNKLNNMSKILEEQRNRLAELENTLKASGSKNKMLQTLVETLRTQIEEKDQMIAQLNEELKNKNADIDKLTIHVNNLTSANTTLTETVAARDQTITQQTDRMNEVYVKIASKSDLKAAGLLSGGFLQKKKLDPTAIDKNLFQTADKRRFSQVSIPSKKAKVISQMPADSYTLTVEGNNTTLTVTDAAKFWSVTNFLIIQLN